MTDCGEVFHFLGMRLDYDKRRGCLRLSQKANVDKLLARFEMMDCNPVKTPMEKGIQLTRAGDSTTQPYRELLGSLMYEAGHLLRRRFPWPFPTEANNTALAKLEASGSLH